MAPDYYNRTGVTPAKYNAQKLEIFAFDYLNKLKESLIASLLPLMSR